MRKHRSEMEGDFIYQSINQTNSYSTNIPGEARPNQCSTAKSRKKFRNINRPWEVTVSMGEKPIQKDVPSDIS